jgi:hypothetical protein
MILRLILAAIEAYSGNSDRDARLSGKQVAIGCAVTVVVLAIMALVLPDSVREVIRMLRFLR